MREGGRQVRERGTPGEGGGQAGEGGGQQDWHKRFCPPHPLLTPSSLQVSLPLLSVFGRDSSCSRWLCVFLLEKVALNLSLWSGEEKLSLTTIHLLGSLVRSTER